MNIYYATIGNNQEYYPNASEDELKEIQEVVFLLACAVMQQFYGPPFGEPRPLGGSEWMGGFEESDQEEKEQDQS